ncbi:MAG: bifunctional glutamate N-acetyltransferase/amino-acid acetyltransferase ArgJ [Actinobacteria bacterium]|nr:bifunctional glutamate N-acetyltransferase/amino-acid acetyltransferase ArgJ [Actinomycetota bacterium]NDB31339.1 bifunctional glutamate N-acetyltransferase/amino-acid acetyltransferase ArgJ [Actinomycetota bacterium]
MSTLPAGFRAAGVAAGIKSSGAKDLALLVNDGPNYFGTAVFTSNQVVAAPVTWSQEAVRDREIRAVLLNSGGANACTGPDGFLDTHRSAEKVGELLSISASDVGVCSTGLIGVRLPMEKVMAGIETASKSLAQENLKDLAEAIMTTDSKPKISHAETSGTHFAGVAKGAGMLAPSLATMLSVVMTDAQVDPGNAEQIFRNVCEKTFNRIDSDGCTSTNDTVFFLASGASGVQLSNEELESALTKICSDLASQLIADAEGHSKIVSITTINAKSERDAVEIGRACARNNLLKCALHGEDPNWGRILAAIGTTNAVIDPQRIDVSLNGVWVCKSSAPGEARESVDMKGERIDILIDLHVGSATATILTNDLTAMYVHENSAYAT